MASDGGGGGGRVLRFIIAKDDRHKAINERLCIANFQGKKPKRFAPTGKPV